MKSKSLSLCAALVAVLVLALTSPVFANAGDPLQSINSLSTFVFSAIRAIGALIVGFGILQLGLSFKSHDPQQKANGLLAVFGGLIIAFAKDILDLIM